MFQQFITRTAITIITIIAALQPPREPTLHRVVRSLGSHSQNRPEATIESISQPDAAVDQDQEVS